MHTGENVSHADLTHKLAKLQRKFINSETHMLHILLHSKPL